MKTRYIYATAFSLLMGTASMAQQQLKFTSYNKLSDHYVKASAFAFLKTDYQVDLGQEFTSLLIKIPTSASLFNSYIVVNKDTIKFRKDGRTDPQVIGSQLIVFRTPQTQLVFHSEDISGKVEFNLFNSQPTAAFKTIEPVASPKTSLAQKTSTKAKSISTNEKTVTAKQTEKPKPTMAQSIEPASTPLPVHPPSVQSLAESTYSGQPLASLDRHESMHRHDGLDRHPDPYYKPRRKN